MENAFMGQIALFAFNYAPINWAPSEGQLLSIMENNALFSLIGTTFGGNGTDNFALPDLRGKAPINGLAYYIAVNGMYPPR